MTFAWVMDRSGHRNPWTVFGSIRRAERLEPMRDFTAGAASAAGRAMTMPTIDAAPMPAAAAGTGSYDDIVKLLQGAAPEDSAQGQGQRQKSSADGGGITRGEAPGGPAMSQAQARQQLDLRRFYSILTRGARG